MNRIEKVITLPVFDNDGKPLDNEHAVFQTALLIIAGGFSASNQSGAWRDERTGKVYNDTSVRYTVLCTSRQASKIDALIPQLCQNCRQECILVTTRALTAQFVTAQVLAVSA